MSKVKYCSVSFREYEATGDTNVNDINLLWSGGKRDEIEQVFNEEKSLVQLRRILVFKLPEPMTKDEFNDWIEDEPSLIQEKREGHMKN